MTRGRAFITPCRWESRALIAIMAGFVLVLFFVGLFAVPNNFDSMTYHLARVAQWRQNHSIAFYGTENSRQNCMPPWAEWTMLQLTLLQGSDRLVNLVQWLSFIGCMIGASLITERLGGSRRDAIIAAFFVATLPGAIYESTSTQNDLVMSFWLICAAYGCVKATAEAGWTGPLIFAASLGLCLLTKTVTLIFVAPLGVWMVRVTARRGLAQALPCWAAIATVALVLNAGHMARNYATSGHLLGPDVDGEGSGHYLNEVHGPGAIFSNVVRNLSLHTGFFHKKAWAQPSVIGILHALGINPNDPRTTYGSKPYAVWQGGEDGTPMPYHLLLIACGLIAAFWVKPPFRFAALALAASLLTGAFLFCAILKWQSFHARLHLPLFCLGAPLAALPLSRVRWELVTWLVLLALLAASTPAVFRYSQRPALGKRNVFNIPGELQQPLTKPESALAYNQVRQFMLDRKVREVGLISGGNAWQYPLFTVNRAAAPWRIDEVLIQSPYASLERHIVPDVVLCTRGKLGPELAIHGKNFKLNQTYAVGPGLEQSLSIYLPDPAP